MTNCQPATLKLRVTLCITWAQSLVRREFQLDCIGPSAALDDFRRRPAITGSRSGRNLHKPRGILQPVSSGRGRSHRLGRASHATTLAQGYRSADPCPVVAQCAGIDLRDRSGFLRPPASDVARLSGRRTRGRHLLRDQRHRCTACTAQAALINISSQLGCHPEQASVAQRRIWSIRATRRDFCDARIARSDRFHFQADPTRANRPRATF